MIVSDKNGNPILDLKPEEFSVSEDGKAQKIEQFSVVKIDPLDQIEGPSNGPIRTQQDEQREAARPEVRLFTILLDDYHVRRGNDMAVRKPLIDFIQNQLAPADMVAIMYPMTPVNDISFTRNRASLISAIEKFEGRKFNYTARNEFEEQYTFYPAATVERIRNQITMGALEAAAIRMGGLREGRKSIIFVSEGLTESLPPQLNDPVAALPGFGNPNRNNAQAQTDEREDWARKTDMLTELRRVFQTVNTQNTSIYSVDPRGLAVFEYGINEGVGLQQDSQGLKTSLDTLYTLSNNTDGRAIVNRNDLAVGMKQIMRDSSGYYLLGYTSTARSDRRKVPRDQGQREAPRRRGSCPQGLLGTDQGRRQPRHGAAETAAAGGGNKGTDRARGTARRSRRQILGRHLARRSRPQPRDVRLGTGHDRSRQDRGRAGCSRAAHGRHQRGEAGVPRPRARRINAVTDCDCCGRWKCDLRRAARTTAAEDDRRDRERPGARLEHA